MIHGSPVTIAVVTYRRLDDLASAIPPILREAATSRPVAGILIVDNDPDGSAAQIVARFADQGVRYVHEPSPGIAAARNRALRAAGGSPLLIFIDDDEHPEPGWLSALLQTQASTGAAAVAGPVLSRFDVEPDEWIRAGRFFDRRRLPTGTDIDVAATNNLLLDLSQVAPLRLRFDERFGLSGGSDTLFTRQLVRAGCRMVWCNEAIVIDRVPRSRLQHRWVLQRAYRSGNSATRVSLTLSSSRSERARVRLRSTVHGAMRVTGGAFRMLAGVLAGSISHRARGRRTINRGAGMLAGAYGGVYAEYARVESASVPTDGRCEASMS